MSDMILNDSVPIDKKWSELIRYNIFIMKLVEFVIAFVITLLPLVCPSPNGHMYCISSGPTLVISFIFIILYLRRKVALFMEKMYLFFQILFTFGAFVQCFLLNVVRVWLWLIYGVFYFALLTALSLDLFLIARTLTNPYTYIVTKGYKAAAPILLLHHLQDLLKVISMLLMILPFVLEEPVIVHCLAIAPTLVLSVIFIVLYLVDQVHDLAEQLYLVIQISLTVFAFLIIFINPSPSGALIGLFYCHQLVALSIDIYYVIMERGFVLFKS